MRVIRARHVATMVSPLIEDGCVIIDGPRIAAVGPTRDLNPPHVDHEIDGVLMPGLINAHTHLELTNVARPPSPGTFQDWILTTMAAMREPDEAAFAAKRAEAVRQGIAQCLKFGVTCVGDITQNVDIVRPILREGPIRSISYGECLGLGERRARFEELMKRALDRTHASERMRIGLSPHAPYTVEARDYRRAMLAGEKIGGFVTTHLAETTDEDAFLDGHAGPFGDMYRRLGFDPGPGKRSRGGAISFAASTGVLSNALLAHVNHIRKDVWPLIRSARPRVVWCPRTHAYLRHPPHPWRRLIAAGATVCIGTDSCASSGDLNLVDDLRLLHAAAPDVDVADLWAMVTTQSSLAMRGTLLKSIQPSGTIAAGPVGDMIAFPTATNDPLREILETSTMLPGAVWIGGVPVVSA